MKVTGIGLCTPPGAKDNPQVTPELLASSLARYSRSNKGIDTILQSIDWNDPDKSVDSIFRFVDYGHASITGMTGGIAIAVDDISMFLAFKIFEIAQLCDGQESSTRYIQMDKSSLPDPEQIGIPKDLRSEWLDLMVESFETYHLTYDALDRKATENPSVIRLPDGIDEKIANRIRKNYALDRARYFIPFATKTNAAYVMTARVWAETVRQLDSLSIPEAQNCATLIRKELEKFVPRMVRHSYPTEASNAQSKLLSAYSINEISNHGVGIKNIDNKVHLSILDDTPDFLPPMQSLDEAFRGKTNRYSTTGTTVNRCMVRAAWNNIAIAELRDLNRHRSGYRFSPLIPKGFYLPQEVYHPGVDGLLDKQKQFTEKLALSTKDFRYCYGLLLGAQTPFEHSTHLDKFIYEIELRTGLGAHYRYAQHLKDAYDKLIELRPELKDHLSIGDAEPEF
ncbi:FAD-dependent thymidylate synthase [Chitinispirillales bacterium ANBcel5]|uniref:FAD-dependent thymidylate synthase n=1 Tax=Cellulosispirillum alkaliphilum TaxID=3039283 RepID=UPI002A52B89A|nr:FAD-dependent thymidylate synthase [Chitinispirillales bacterium ANBcel5]